MFPRLRRRTTPNFDGVIERPFGSLRGRGGTRECQVSTMVGTRLVSVTGHEQVHELDSDERTASENEDSRRTNGQGHRQTRSDVCGVGSRKSEGDW